MRESEKATKHLQDIDSLTAANTVFVDAWLDNITMPVVDCLGNEFLNYVKDSMTVTIEKDGTVCVE